MHCVKLSFFLVGGLGLTVAFWLVRFTIVNEIDFWKRTWRGAYPSTRKGSICRRRGDSLLGRHKAEKFKGNSRQAQKTVLADYHEPGRNSES